MSSKAVRKLIDIGANLTDPMFKGIYNSSQKHQNDFDSMLNRARENGVEKMIITGGSLSDSEEALKIADLHENLYSTVGCHPTRCSEFDNHNLGRQGYLDKLFELASSPANKSKVVAIGEIGLDYDRLHFCPKEVQQQCFNLQLDLAQKTRLPLFLHNRNSIDDFIRILEENKEKFTPSGGVVHSFDGSAQDMNRILGMGFYIGINGCSLKTEQNLQVAKLIPSNRLMIETDCPWCEIRQSHASFKHINTIFKKSKDASDEKLPVKNRNEPMSLIQVLEVLSAIRNEDLDELTKQVYENTNKLFFN